MPKKRARVIIFPQEQCQAMRHETYACDTKGKRYRCSRTSTHTIDDVKLCRIHAGKMALRILQNEDESITQ